MYFIENTKISSEITEIDEELIKHFHIILQVISSGFEIDAKKFQKYAIETAQKLVDLYPWFNMPTTVHKILIHGHQIIESSLLPIGQMSGEAQESCNKSTSKNSEKISLENVIAKKIWRIFSIGFWLHQTQ